MDRDENINHETSLNGIGLSTIINTPANKSVIKTKEILSQISHTFASNMLVK